MRRLLFLLVPLVLLTLLGACTSPNDTAMDASEPEAKTISAADILGDPSYRAISYGGYRMNSRDQQPTVAQLKEDMLLLHALGIRVLRTYNVQLAHAGNVLKAIRELRAEDPAFEMYVMLGAWIDCKNAWTDQPPNHDVESEKNAAEIARAVALAKEYPEVVKVIAVGNEAMVKWAAAYFVQPGVILKWVRHLQGLKADGELPADLWITSSDNFASWGGGGAEYHVPDLDSLIHAVDYISLHTYPMHDTHYNPSFWGVLPGETDLPKAEQLDRVMTRSLEYAQQQFDSVAAYVRRVGADKPLHIGETGWASSSDGLYGPEGSAACDEYKQAAYHDAVRQWTDRAGISCFFFEAFDEPWKDAGNPAGSENYFGLFTVDGRAKFVLWDAVDEGTFAGLTRGGEPIRKTYDGDRAALLESVVLPEVRAVSVQ